MVQHILLILACVAFVYGGFNCPTNTCRSLGQTCSPPTPNSPYNVCGYGLYCSAGTCQTTKGQGTSCASDSECSDNLACVSQSESCSSVTTSQPKWLQGKGLNEWLSIPNTAGAGGSAIDAFSGFAFNDLTNEVFIGLAGGHGDSADNRVVSIKVTDDEPTWVLRCESSVNVTKNVAYYSDGKPASRHTYSNIFFVPQVNRLMFFGVRFSYGDAFTFPQYVDGFNPSSNTWDKNGTWANNIGGSFGTVMVRSTGEVFTTLLDKWSPSNTWTASPFSRLPDDNLRWPVVHDPVRNQLFNLQWSDGEGFGRQNITASRIPLNGTVQIEVTFNPSAAFTQFLVDKPVSSGMDYDPDNDRFLYYCGIGSGAGRIYTVTPNNGNVWDMGILALGPNSETPTETPGSGVNNRFRYIPSLKGFLMLSRGAANLSFIRTSDATCNSGTANVLKCSTAVSGPGFSCSQDSECYFHNSTLNAKQKSTCINKKCYGLDQSATCTGPNQCNLGLFCKASVCTTLGSAGQSCTDQSECKAGLTCKKTSKDGQTKSCVAYAQGVAGTYCEDSSFCGDNLYCDSTSMTCMSGNRQVSCNCSCTNPSGLSSAITSLDTCWQNNPSCRGVVPCSNCTTQICTLYSLSPLFLSDMCTDSNAKKAALQACPAPVTSTATSGLVGGPSTSSKSASSTSSSPPSSTTSLPSDASASSSITSYVSIVFCVCGIVIGLF